MAVKISARQLADTGLVEQVTNTLFSHGLDARHIELDVTETALMQDYMAHNLGCGVIAEGVETEAQASWLAVSGCDELQGFLLWRPAPEGYRSSQEMAR